VNPKHGSAARVVSDAYNGQTNFMTPEVLRYGWLPDGCAYELSTGTGIGGQPIWGVTIVDPKRPQDRPKRSKCCHSLEEAETHIKAGAPE